MGRKQRRSFALVSHEKLEEAPHLKTYPHLDDLRDEPQHQVRLRFHQVPRPDVDNRATDRLGGIDAQRLVLVLLPRVQLLLDIQHAFVDRALDRDVDQLAQQETVLDGFPKLVGGGVEREAVADDGVILEPQVDMVRVGLLLRVL